MELKTIITQDYFTLLCNNVCIFHDYGVLRMIYQPRVLEQTLNNYLRYFSVVGLTGPRQSGKSTLLQHTLPDYTYVTFDDYRMMSVMHDFIEDGDIGFLVYQGENFLYHSPMSVLNYKEFLSVI